MSTFKIVLFRHGETRYRQGNIRQSVATARDLAMPEKGTNEALEEYIKAEQTAEKEVADNAKKLLPYLDAHIPVTISSSPMGRALHTARVIAETLKSHGFTLADIATDGDLREVDGFVYELFSPLHAGGNVRWKDGNGVYSEYMIDASLTNPQGLDGADYFFHDVLPALPAHVLDLLPAGLRQHILRFESSAHCQERMKRKLQDVLERGGKERQPEQHIQVTHSALTASFMRRWSKDKAKELPKGGWILLEAKHLELFITATSHIAGTLTRAW